MKKIILVLMFSLGLVSVANAESVCKKLSYDDIISKFPTLDYGNNLTNEQVDVLLGRKLYVKEIKRSDKESMCVYKLGFDSLKTKLSKQELESFERYLAENDWYNSYENNKYIYLAAVKFSKFRNALEEIYNLKGDAIYELGSNIQTINTCSLIFAKSIYGNVKFENFYVMGHGTCGYASLVVSISDMENPVFNRFTSYFSENELNGIIKWAKAIDSSK